MVAEQIGEVLIGSAIGVIVDKTLLDKCNLREGLVVAGGATVMTWMIARAFGKQFYKWCDSAIPGADFKETIEQM